MRDAIELKRTLNIFDATSIGIGAIIGGGIFVVTGISAGLAGPAVVLSVLISGAISCLTALSFAELSSAIPKEGGAYAYAHETINPFAGFMVGWLWLISNIVAGAAISIGLASYISILIPILPVKVFAISACIIVTLVNLFGIRESSLVNNLLVLVKISVLFFFISLGMFHLNSKNLVPLMPNGWIGVFQGAALIFFAYAGFARITTVAEEVKNPERTIPMSILLSLGICMALYTVTSFIAVGLVNYRDLASSGSPLSDAAIATGNPLASLVITLGAITATTSVLLTTIIGLSRVSFAMSRDLQLPRFFGRVHAQFRTPYISIIIVGAAMTILASFADLRQVVAISSFASLCYYATTNVSALLLRKRTRTRLGTFKVPLYPVFPLLGLASCIMLIFFLTYDSILIGTVAAIAGGVYYLARKQATRRFSEFKAQGLAVKTSWQMENITEDNMNLVRKGEVFGFLSSNGVLGC